MIANRLQAVPAVTLFLTGFMGAGKSSVGKALSKLAGLPFVDLDDAIVERSGRAITEIFASHGEEYFRNIESEVLHEYEPAAGGVCATGGGIVLREENRRRMRAIGLIIYLRTGWDTVSRRLEGSVGRPLVEQSQSRESLRGLWEKRQTLYLDADMIIDTDNLTPLQVAVQILAALGLRGDGA